MSYEHFDLNEAYKKNKDLRKEDVKALMQWANLQPHLPTVNEQDAMLFLHSCYNSNEAAKTTLDTYYSIRTLCPDLFLGLNPSDPQLAEHMNCALVGPLPKTTPEGYLIIYGKLVDANPDNFNLASQLKLFDMAISLFQHRFGPSTGHIIVIDLEGVTFSHLVKLGPLTVKKFLYYLQEAMPVRLKGFHYINTVSFMDKIMALTKPFMKKELIDVLHLHTTVDGLTKYVPFECLPKDCGGNLECISVLHENYKRDLINNTAFFEWDNNQKVDESKRPGKPKNVGEYFGVEGTFKKLEVD